MIKTIIISCLILNFTTVCLSQDIFKSLQDLEDSIDSLNHTVYSREKDLVAHGDRYLTFAEDVYHNLQDYISQGEAMFNQSDVWFDRYYLLFNNQTLPLIKQFLSLGNQSYYNFLGKADNFLLLGDKFYNQTALVVSDVNYFYPKIDKSLKNIDKATKDIVKRTTKVNVFLISLVFFLAGALILFLCGVAVYEYIRWREISKPNPFILGGDL